MKISGLNHITLAVRNIDRSFAFYCDLLGFKPLVKWDKGAYFLVGKKNSDIAGSGLWFCLNEDPQRSPHACYTHYAFTVSEKDFEEIATKIIAIKTPIFKENTSPGKSLYFLDPDGHKLEIHVGTPEARILAKKADPGSWKNSEWFV